LVGKETLEDPAELSEVADDLTSECSKHGPLLGVHIVIQETSPDVGKALVHFEDAASAARAFQAINGRHFDGHVIVASYASAEKFQQLAAGLC